MMSWSIAQEKYNDKLYFRKNPVYKVENSLLIKWMLIESCGFYSETDLKGKAESFIIGKRRLRCLKGRH